MSQHPDGTSVVPFVLPGPVADRETVEGWRHWRLTRHTFQPAPGLSLADYRALSPRKRTLHDLHRAATHANLPLQETPMSTAVARLLRSRLKTNALKHKPTTRPGLMITGRGYQGKTETACEIAAAFEDAWLDLHNQLNPTAIPGTRDLHAPVAYVQTPVTAKPKSTCHAILDFVGADHKGMTLPQLTRAVRTSLRDHGNRVLLLDDITRLTMHRADDQDTLDLMRAFMSMHTTLVLIGVNIPSSGLLREGRHDPRTGQWVFPHPSGAAAADDPATQTERRFDLIHLEPFRYDTPANIAAWTAHLAGLEEYLRLFHARAGMLTGGSMPEYLFRRTGGIVGLLERLIEDGCAEAIDTGTEKLTENLLDTILINLGNDPTRDPTAGEVPNVPAKRTRARNTSKARNTVFDEPASRPPTMPACDGSPIAASQPRPAAGRIPGRFPSAASHRLELPPLRIAELTGLRKRAGVPPVILQQHLPADQTAAFAHATRLTLEEVSRLCLNSLRDHYPPLNLHYTNAIHARRDKDLPSARRWLLGNTTRYYPDCLAGEKNPIQQAHGGPWRKRWRLAVIFACPIHRRLLRHTCPCCHRPALERPQVNACLIPAPRLVQHPAQCRGLLTTRQSNETPLRCGNRFDQDPDLRLKSDEHRLQYLLDFQDQLVARMNLNSDATAVLTGGSGYFYDLHLITRLVRASWPFAAQFAPPHIDVDLIDRHIDQLNQTMSQGP